MSVYLFICLFSKLIPRVLNLILLQLHNMKLFSSFLLFVFLTWKFVYIFMFSRFDTKKLFANVNRNSFDIDLCQLLKFVNYKLSVPPSTRRRS
jgi:hypothetical protein